MCKRSVRIYASALTRKVEDALTIFYGGTARFVSDLVGHPDDRFSRDEAHILYITSLQIKNVTLHLFASLSYKGLKTSTNLRIVSMSINVNNVLKIVQDFISFFQPQASSMDEMM